MANVSQEAVREQAVREERVPAISESGAMAEGIIGTGAIVLSVIGLAGIYSFFMVAVATILVGIALLMNGFATSGRLSGLAPEISGQGTLARLGGMELGGGMATEFLGGVAGIVLGILALVGVMPVILVSIAAIVFGGSLIFGISASLPLLDLEIDSNCQRMESRRVIKAAVRSAEGMQMIIGLGAVVLGILAVIGLVPMILTLITMLSLGFADLMSGNRVIRRMLHSYCVE